MRGIWLEHGGITVREDLPRPVPGPGEALVKVRLAGVCGTDLALLRGYYPYTGIPGHEFVGEIIEAASAAHSVGERVVGEINLGCGQCEWCRNGLARHCPQRKVLGLRGQSGAMAEYLVLPLENLLTVPDNLPDEVAVFCEPLAAALEIAEQVALRPCMRVLVVGAGRLGQIIAQVLNLSGCRLRVVARHPRQQAILEARGIHWLAEEKVGPREYDLAVEATGNPAGFALARRALKPRGTLVLKSTYPGGLSLASPAELVVDEITLVGSRCGPFQPALRLLANRLIDPLPLIDARLPLRQGADAFTLAAQRGALKVLLDCQDAT